MKKIISLLFVLSLFLLAGCNKTYTLENGTYYDKNNMYNGSSLERISLKEENKVEKTTCGKDAGCSFLIGTYEIKENKLTIELTHYQDDFDGLVELEEKTIEEYEITEKNTFKKDKSEFVFEKSSK